MGKAVIRERADAGFRSPSFAQMPASKGKQESGFSGTRKPRSKAQGVFAIPYGFRRVKRRPDHVSSMAATL